MGVRKINQNLRSKMYLSPNESTNAKIDIWNKINPKDLNN